MTGAWLPQGTVYGTLMNFRDEHVALAQQMDAPPYKAAPRSPVLYIKTANTFSAHGSAIALPTPTAQVAVRATVGLIFKRNSPLDQQNKAEAAINNAASIVLMSDLTIPHQSFYRPPVKFNCVDHFLCAGQQPNALPNITWLDALTLTVRINGTEVQRFSTADLVRNARQLVADVAEFIDLQTGDVLMIGSPFHAPLARAGDMVEISAPGCAPLHHTLVAPSKERP